jgi:two-component system, NtrC family, nitrogen regulation sensor histidine kinase NtrY
MPPPTGPNRQKDKRSSTPAIVALSIAIFFLFAIILAQATFKLTFLQPDTSEETIIFASVSALIFLLFVALTFVLIRTLLRLYAERKTGAFGSKFRSHMVMGALLLSLGPVIFLFLFSYGLLNRSIEKWFSRPAEDVQYHTNLIASLLTEYASTNAQDEAQRIAATANAQKSFHTGNFTSIMDEFRNSEITLQGGFAFALVDDRAEASFHAPENWPLLSRHIPAAADPGRPKPFDLLGESYVLGRAHVGDHGQILVAMPLPPNYSGTLRDIESSQEQYRDLRLQRRRLRRTYLGLLLLLTIGVLFASTWLALYLSKMVTRPLVALAEATHEISRGNLDYRVDVPAGSEIGQLVESFNSMAADLAAGRSSIEQSRRELADMNAQLEQRTRHIETILESVPSGVLSLDASRRIVHSNAAVRRLLHLDQNPALAAETLHDLFPAEAVTDLEHMLRKAERMGSTTSQMEIATPRVNLNVAVTVASLDPPIQQALRNGRQRTGYVVVLEDLTDLLRAQKQTAWREVARRIAHEIKNPLTPLSLSAERIHRHLERATPPDAASLSVIRQCAITINSSVETVRKLVDEFSTLARFPASKPQPSDINGIVGEALLMFDGRLDDITMRTFLGSELPAVQADPEAMKRAIANLVDNAAEALHDSLVKQIVISTAVTDGRDSIEIVVADSGHGVTSEVKEKLFLPYFSTKRRGTGLGLAIVSRIIEDHHGSIRVEENSPVGARFIVELPLAQEMAYAASANQDADHSDRG